MNGNKNMTVSEAARRMGKSDLFVREGIRLGELPFGSAVLTGEKKKRWSFHISSDAFERYMKLGKIPEQEKEMS